jgi:signal transduction histidine kinase
MGALDRAIALCVETLKYGRSVETPVKIARFALRPLLVEVKESLGVDDHDGIKLTLSVAPAIELSADRDQIFRVFANLIRNALEALKGQDPPPEHPTIEISAARRDGALVIRVSDNGPGIPEQARAHLFQAFQSSSRGNGTGLGLAICAELLHAHGGNIALDAGTKGAAFLVTLPEVAAPAPPRSRNVSSRADRTLAH